MSLLIILVRKKVDRYNSGFLIVAGLARSAAHSRLLSMVAGIRSTRFLIISKQNPPVKLDLLKFLGSQL